MMPGWIEPPQYDVIRYEGRVAKEISEAIQRKLWASFFAPSLLIGRKETVAYDDWEDRLHAMTMHHVDLSLLDLTYTYDPDAFYFTGAIAIT